jgi:hypothetical protein
VSPQCNQKEFDFGKHFRRQIAARFDGGPISSDGGAILLREVDRRLRLIERLGGCFEDRRDPQRVEHSVRELLAQRLYAIALGYEDLNDHDELRRDPLLALLAGKQDLNGQDRKRRRDRGQALAGKTTLQRLERTTNRADRHKKIVCDVERVDQLLVDLFVEACSEPPRWRRRPNNTARQVNRRGCSASFNIRRARVGAGRGGWWPRPSSSKARRIRATWSRA